MSRPHGAVTSAAALGPFGHLAWGYYDRAEFLVRAAEYIADGLARKQRILYSSDVDARTLRNELAQMGFAEAVQAKRVVVAALEEFYRFVPGTNVVDPAATIAHCVAVLDVVVGRGYSGCRAVVDGAVLARTPEQRAALSQLEYLIDQEIAVRPFSALCAYDLRLVGDTAKEMMCLHPFVGPETAGFHIYADRDVDFALAGEVDASEQETFATAMQRIWPLSTGDELVIGAHALDFIAHHHLVLLDHLGRAKGRQVVLRTDQPVVRRLAELLELGHVRVEAPPLLAGAS